MIDGARKQKTVAHVLHFLARSAREKWCTSWLYHCKTWHFQWPGWSAKPFGGGDVWSCAGVSWVHREISRAVDAQQQSIFRTLSFLRCSSQILRCMLLPTSRISKREMEFGSWSQDRLQMFTVICCAILCVVHSLLFSMCSMGQHCIDLYRFIRLRQKLVPIMA